LVERQHTDDNLIYIEVDGVTVILDEITGRQICESMATLATYLGYDQTYIDADEARRGVVIKKLLES
jgi:hypothetical protein